MKLYITIDTQRINDDEVARILRRLTNNVARHGTPLATQLKDSNGNIVGAAFVKYEGNAEYARSASITSRDVARQRSGFIRRGRRAS
jgi:hypothetical protein